MPDRDWESEYWPKVADPNLCAIKEIISIPINKLVNWNAIPKNELFTIPLFAWNKLFSFKLRKKIFTLLNYFLIIAIMLGEK